MHYKYRLALTTTIAHRNSRTVHSPNEIHFEQMTSNEADSIPLCLYLTESTYIATAIWHMANTCDSGISTKTEHRERNCLIYCAAPE